ncbi:MAG: hypothetical protein ABSD59_16775 [Terracidiphilus sp.]|jgi:hypothetical protein
MSTNASSSVVILPNSEGILCNAQSVEGTRTPDDIIRMAQPATKKQERLLLDLSQLIHGHPQFLPQLTELVRSRLETGNRAASVREAFERVRWDQHVSMRNALVPLVGRMLLYVNCDLNGMVQLIPRPIDETFGGASQTRNCRATMRGGWRGAMGGHLHKHPH